MTQPVYFSNIPQILQHSLTLQVTKTLFIQAILTFINPVNLQKRFFLLLLTGISLSFASCMPGRHIPEDRHLLNRNRIVIEDEADADPHQLRNFIRQNPNRRILGFYRFHLRTYLWASKRDETRFRLWLKNNIGEPPVLFDPSMAELTTTQFEMYMNNRGYFNAEASFDVSYRRKKANVTYTVQGNQPYTIRQIYYTIPDEYLAGFIYADTVNSLIVRGQRYDTGTLQNERQRLTRHLREEGFFNFSRDFINFRVDSTLNQKQADIEILVSNPFIRPATRNDTVVTLPHTRFKINNIYVYPEYSRLNPGQHFADTTVIRSRRDNDKAYVFLHNGPMAIRPRTIIDNILLQPGEYYSLSQQEQTHHALAGLRNFRFVNLQFNEVEHPDYPQSDTLKLMNAKLQLTRSAANAFSIEAEGLNTAGNLGIAGNFLYQNRNILGGAEIFNLRLKGALEVSGESSDVQIFGRLPFNTGEIGADVSIDIPKLIAPVQPERLSQVKRPKTTILTGINYRQRPDYTRYIINFSYGYRWNPDPRSQHQFTPLEISSIKIFNDSILQSRIPEDNPLILSRYRDHLIGGMQYNYTHTTQQIDRKVNFIYLRSNLELAGNIMYLLADRLSFPKNEDNNYTIGEIPFAQFVKADADFRYYHIVDENNTIAFRVMGGLGVPYGNSEVMPFIKSYYGGGANSVRAWSIYNLGPGGYQDPDALRFDKYGDIKLEANVEYRFPLYRYWHGALFADAGNVWFLGKNDQFPLGDFSINRFYKEIAVGAGLGVRLDFNFFLVRLDAAFRLRDPALPPGERWMTVMPGFSKWNFNLGIGYPF